jgi:Arc/MetJ family transcription regulator
MRMRPAAHAAHRSRTTVNLDLELVHEASAVLGTARTTDTLHAALRDVVQRERRDRLTQQEFPDLSLERLDQLRDVRPSHTG